MTIIWCYDRLLNKLRSFLIRYTSGSLRIKVLRRFGVKIGENCLIYAKEFSTECYLIEIGNHVAIANGTHFITHDGSPWILREKHPNLDVFGPIKIGDNTFVGINTVIMPNTVIGSNCVIGAGSVVRGNIPDNSVAFGNPAKVVFKTDILERLLLNHANAIHTKNLTFNEKKTRILEHLDRKTKSQDSNSGST